MKDSTLRIVLFAIILIFGSLMILFDIPVFYLLVGAVILGILVIFLTGTVKLPTLKRKKGVEKAATPVKEPPKMEKEKKPLFSSLKLPFSKKKKGELKGEVTEKAALKKEKERKPKKEKQEKKVKSPGQKGGTGEFFSSLKGAFAVLGKNLKRGTRSKRERETHEKKIDTLLDQSIRGGGVASLDDILPEATPAEKKKEVDPFTALVGEDLNADLLNDIEGADDFSILDDSELGSGTGIGEAPAMATGPDAQADVSGMDIGLSGDEAPIMLDETNDADEVKDILEANKGEIDLSQDAGMDLGEDAMEGLDGLDLEGIDLGEAEAPAAAPAAAPASGSSAGMKAASPPAGSPLGKSEPPKPAAPAFSPEQDMLSFSKGKGQDDDLMASLKSDVKSVKKNDYASLIRDMKDIRVDVTDLKSELEELLKPKKPSAK